MTQVPPLRNFDSTLSKPVDSITPRHFGLPTDHTDWREHQLETVLTWLNWYDQPADTCITEAPTGSGKSVYPAAMSHHARTVVVTHTKNLQAAYTDYGAAVLYGRANYTCVHPKADADTGCDDCFFSDKGMHRCPYSQDCEYLIAKDIAHSADFAAVNYAYWLTARSLKDTRIGALVLDEGHLLDNIVLGHSGCQVNDLQRMQWALPTFPKLPKGIRMPVDIGQVHDWLSDSREVLTSTLKTLQHKAELGDEQAKKTAKRGERLNSKLAVVKESLEAVKSAWFVRSGAGKIWHNGRPMPGIVVKPLTPKYHYRRLFTPPKDSDKLFWQTYTMSATIGGFDAFASNLGILKPLSTMVPNQWAPEQRPVYILDCPKMSKANADRNPGIFDQQADAIAQAILSCPSDWSGFVHVTRKAEAKLLAERLAVRGLGNRMWVPPQIDRQTGKKYGTQEQAAFLEQHMLEVPNTIAVCWQFWAGYDGKKQRISVIGKVPFPFYGDEYERERLSFDHSQYNMRAALRLMQGCGRTRRGEPGDYDTPTERHGLVAIADGSLSRIMSYLSPDFVQSLTPWQS